MNKELIVDVEYLISNGFIKEDYTPIKCVKCHSINLKNIVIDTHEDGTVLEMDVICDDCRTTLGYYSYGAWLP